MGDADSIFIHFPNGQTMLVDAGGLPGGSFNVGNAVVAPFLRSQGVRRLDYLVLTHSHQDHAGGLTSILRQFEVGEFWDSGIPSDSRAHLEALAEVRRQGIRHRTVRQGDILRGATYRLEVLHPLKDPPGSNSRTYPLSPNDSSLVLRILHGKVKILLTGDLERAGERALLQSGEPLEPQILKIPHHGGRTSSSWEFLSRVSPEVAVLSAGRPWIGHPSLFVLSRYQEIGSSLFRTDEDGAVELFSDGESYRVRSHLRGERTYRGFLLKRSSPPLPEHSSPLADPLARVDFAR